MAAPPSGYTSTTADNLGIGGTVYVSYNTTSKTGTKIGVTRGGVRFNPGTEMRNVPYDGKLANIYGLDRIVFRNPTISFTLLEASDTNLALRLEPGGATPSTLTESGIFFESGDYVTGLAVEFLKSDGSTKFGYYLPDAVCTQYEVAGQGSDGEVEIAVTFEGRLEHGATPDEGDVPYTLF